MYRNTLATVKHRIQEAENPKPADVLRTEIVSVNNGILLDCLTSEVALEKPRIRCTEPDIPMDNNRPDDELHFRMPGGSEDYDDVGDEIDKSDVIPTTSWR